MKKVTILLVVICLLLPLTACTDINKGVAKTTIELDIKSISENITEDDLLFSNFVYPSNYKCVSTEISKRQTNPGSKQDIVFCNIIFQNKYFQIVFTKKIIYSYYDDIGWSLDDIQLVKKDVIPLCAAEQDLILDHWLKVKPTNYSSENYINARQPSSRFLMGSFSTVPYVRNNLSCELDKENLLTKLHFTIQCGIGNISGYIPLEFNATDGWKLPSHSVNEKEYDRVLYYIVSDMQIDFSIAEGVFETRKYDEEYDDYYVKTISVSFIEAKNLFNIEAKNRWQSGDRGSGQSSYYEPLNLTTCQSSNWYYDRTEDVWVCDVKGNLYYGTYKRIK